MLYDSKAVTGNLYQPRCYNYFEGSLGEKLGGTDLLACFSHVMEHVVKDWQCTADGSQV